MKKAIYIFLIFSSMAICQNKKSIPATIDNKLKIFNGSRGDCKYLEDPTYIINKEYVIYEDCKTHKIIYPDLNSFRTPKYGREGFAFDKNGVYVRGELVKTDTTGFVLLNDNLERGLLWKTKSAVFNNLVEVKGIDASAFTFLNRPYFKDKKYIYYFDKKIDGSDAESASETSDGCRDKNYCYTAGKIATYDGEPLQYVNYYLRKTKEKVFFQRRIVPNRDAKTLVGLSRNFAMDKKYVYYDIDTVPIKPENFNKIKTWNHTNSAYITDGKIIYSHTSKTSREFDVATFGMFPITDYCYDKNGVYEKKYDKKLGDVIFVKMPFKYTANVSSDNTFTGKHSNQYVFYENQCYEPSTNTLYENLTAEQLEQAKNKELQLSNIEGANELKYKFDYQFYKLGNHIYCQNKLTDIDGKEFRPIGKSHCYYRDNENVYYYTREQGLQNISEVDVNSARIFSSFLIDKDYLYSRNIKIIGSQGIELLAIFPGYRAGCGLDETPGSNFYLFKNNEGFWLVKISNEIKYRFLGKTFDRNWDSAFEEIELFKQFGNAPKIKKQTQAGGDSTVNKVADNSIDNKVHTYVDIYPEYRGGTKALFDFVSKNFVLPKELKAKGANDQKIYTRFIIEKDGSVSDIKILIDLGYGTGKELTRVLKLMPNWIPAMLNGENVRYLCTYSFKVN